MKIAVGIATAGRRQQMGRTLEQLARQQRLPDAVVICPASPDDFDVADAAHLAGRVSVVHGERGLTRQRNTIIDACAAYDVVLFIDDDYYPAPGYITELEQALSSHPDIVVMTNHPIADGATGPGISHDQALECLAAHTAAQTQPGNPIAETYGGYGCNMAMRLSVIRGHHLRFDARLPLYGWLEDIDFSRQMSTYGRVCHNRRLVGVHLGTKAGRTSGLKLGYSQVANPIYLHRKGTMDLAYAWQHIWRNIASNLLRSLRPEPWVDRAGRLRGNIRALFDLMCARIHPERVQTL
jgi:GT2 family glycosyltransferase